MEIEIKTEEQLIEFHEYLVNLITTTPQHHSCEFLMRYDRLKKRILYRLPKKWAQGWVWDWVSLNKGAWPLYHLVTRWPLLHLLTDQYTLDPKQYEQFLAKRLEEHKEEFFSENNTPGILPPSSE